MMSWSRVGRVAVVGALVAWLSPVGACASSDPTKTVDVDAATPVDSGSGDGPSATVDALAPVDAGVDGATGGDATTDAQSDATVDATIDAASDAASDAKADGTADAANDASTDAKVDGTSDGGVAGCADGTRDGLSATTYPKVAACAGTWSGDVGTATLCAVGSHVCTGAEAALKAVAYADAVAVTGCFAIDAAQDGYVCYPDCSAAVTSGVDTAANIDMGAIGSTCPYKYPGGGSCISGGRIDFSENSGTGCNYAAGLSGVVCCAD